MVVPTFDESILYYITLDGENEAEHVKQLRRSVRNTIKRSVSYADSKLKEQFGDVIEGNYKTSESTQQNVAEVKTDNVPVETVVEDPDIPF